MAATTKIWVNSSAPTCEDADLNGFKNENNNLILGAGIILSTLDLQQTHRAVSHYAAGGDFYTAVVAANTATLSITGAHVAPPTYFTGMRVRWIHPNNSNPGNINVAGLGSKQFYSMEGGAGSTFVGNVFRTGYHIEAVYDGVGFIMVANANAFQSSFTAGIVGSIVAGTGWVFSTQTGYYLDRRGLLTMTFSIEVTTPGAGATGSVRITGGPAWQEINSFCSVGGCSVTGTTRSAGYENFNLRTSGSPNLLLEEQGASGSRGVPVASILAGTSIRGSIAIQTLYTL